MRSRQWIVPRALAGGPAGEHPCTVRQRDDEVLDVAVSCHASGAHVDSTIQGCALAELFTGAYDLYQQVRAYEGPRIRG